MARWTSRGSGLILVSLFSTSLVADWRVDNHAKSLLKLHAYRPAVFDESCLRWATRY